MVTEIEKKALALVNEVRLVMPLMLSEAPGQYGSCWVALCCAIEQHEAFRQEVSDAVEGFWNYCRTTDTPFPADLDRFIIAKPDPLVEHLVKVEGYYPRVAEEVAGRLRAAIEKRGGKIVWGEG